VQELEIATFAADLRAQQQSAILLRIGEPGSRAIALDDRQAFVELGDEIKEGQPVCIIEAMKIMNEIEADIGGKIVRILCENGQAVEFGQPLFIVE
jgi:biotin carboxyl carrier protein